MKLYVPDYYADFRCIADKCRHSCCVGWEIDIDDETYNYYKTVGGNLGKRLADGISDEGGTAHFVLGEGERCPFLNKNGLCDIISELGEGALCQICADHPRWRGFYSDRTEMGVGMCCEAAAELILTHKGKTRLVLSDDDGIDCGIDETERRFFLFRERILDILQNRTEPVAARMKKMLSECGGKLPEKSISEWADIYLSLERLDEEWTKRLLGIKNLGEVPRAIFENDFFENAFEQAAVYFIYRHLGEGVYDGRIFERAAFAVLSVYMLAAAYAAGANVDTAPSALLCDAARMYSAEIEYSEGNMETLFEVLGENC